MNIATIDFETEGIIVGSSCPPKPIGVAIKEGHKEAVYYFFGHESEEHKKNKDRFYFAKAILEKIVESEAELLFHNAKFDLRVMKHYFGLEIKDYKRIHDTMLLLFLYDPNQKRLGLKESAERLLGIKPEDKETLKQYMIDNQESMGIKISTSEKSSNYYMCMLKYAPHFVVGKYACNDVEITYKLFSYLFPKMFGNFI